MDYYAIALIGAAVASAGAQWMNSQSAQKATANERKKMQELVAKLQSPQFDASSLTPEEYQVAGKYVPEIAGFIQEVAPKVVKADSEAAVQGLQAQQAALQKFMNLASTGDDTQSELMRTSALREAQQQNQGQQASIMQGMQRRGMGGSTNELVASLLAQQGSNQSATMASQQAAMDAYNRRLDAMRQSASLGEGLRNQEIGLESKNADIINSYNQRVANSGNQYAQYVAGLHNDAQLKNLATRQNVMDQNVALRNQYAKDNLDRYNQLQQQTFQNNANKVGLATGQGQGQINDIRNAATDRSNAISGLQQGVSTGLLYGNQQQKPAAQEPAGSSLAFKPATYGSYNDDDYAQNKYRMG